MHIRGFRRPQAGERLLEAHNRNGQAVWEFNNCQSALSYGIAAIKLNDESVFENMLSKEFSDEYLDNAQAVYD